MYLSINFVLEALEDEIRFRILELLDLLLLLDLVVSVCLTHVVGVFSLVEHVGTEGKHCVSVSD